MCALEIRRCLGIGPLDVAYDPGCKLLKRLDLRHAPIVDLIMIVLLLDYVKRQT